MQWIVIIQFEFAEGDSHRCFFSAHIFPLDAKGELLITEEITLTADTPEEALHEGMWLAWLLNRS